jgi:hypothetical protein
VPRSLILLALVAPACVHAPPAPPPPTAEAPPPAEAAPPAAASAPAPPPPTALAALPSAPAVRADVAVGEDALALTLAWRVEHNRGVGLLAAGDAAGALSAGLASLGGAPAEARRAPLQLVAAAGAALRDHPVALAALLELAALPDVPWGLFYNGSLDATAARRPDLASRFAQEALARSGDVAAVAPVALRAGLAAGDLDGAARAARALGPAAAPEAVGALARALADAGRCAEARAFDAAACP